MSPTPPRATPRPTLTIALLATVLALAGCATVSPDDTLDATRRALPPGPATLALHTDDARRAEATRAAEQLLAQPLDADAATRLALLHSPALQALVADAWAADVAGAAAARPVDPRFSWERWVAGGEVELTRSLGFGLTDLLLWPARTRVTAADSQARRGGLARDVLAHRQAVRQQWLRAVAARELLTYHEQVRDAADASAELARRMQSTGQFNRLRRAREQAFQADAVARLAQAVQAEVAEREALVRLLGLDSAQARRLQLPDRLPALPAQPRDADAVTAEAGTRRLDLVLAQQALAARLGESPLTAGLIDVEATVKRGSTGDVRGRGVAFDIRLPLLDASQARRAQLDARQLAALNRLAQAQSEAGSLLRERYAGYRTAFDLARQARGTLLPLRQTIADEMLLNYNGMLIGVFELLAEARAQVGAVIGAIEAQRDFWLADAALDAAVLGVPATAPNLNAGSGGATAAPAGH